MGRTRTAIGESTNADEIPVRIESSVALGRGYFAEEIITPDAPKFVVYHDDPESYPVQRDIPGGIERIVPRFIDPKLRGALTLPEGVVPYNSVEQILLDAERLALEVYDPVDQLPMLRLVLRLGVASWVLGLLYPHAGRERYAPIVQIIGLPENGKGRFLTVCRAIFYRPLFLNKTVKVPSLFRAIEPWDGTLILDEADLDRSTESAELIEFLNGRSYGNPILRYSSESDKVRTFQSFGYTILATRHPYLDPGFNSRAIILRAQAASDANRIPLVPDESWYQRALEIRCQLLLFRFRVWSMIRAGKISAPSNVEMEGLSNRFRVRAAFLPLEALKPVAPALIEGAVEIACEIHRRQVIERAYSLEGRLLRMIYEALEAESGWGLRQVGDNWRLERRLQPENGEEPSELEPLTLNSVIEVLGEKTPRRSISNAWKNLGQRLKERDRYGARSPRSILEITDPARLCREFTLYVPDAEPRVPRFALPEVWRADVVDHGRIGGADRTSGTPSPILEYPAHNVPPVPLVPVPSLPLESIVHGPGHGVANASPKVGGLETIQETELNRAVRILGPRIVYPDGTVTDRRTGAILSRPRGTQTGGTRGTSGTGHQSGRSRGPQRGGPGPPADEVEEARHGQWEDDGGRSGKGR